MATSQQIDLGALFFGTYRRRVLSLLLLHADESFHLREIARLTKTQPGTLRRELSLLTEAGVLESEQIGNQVRYRANANCPIYGELRGILRKTTGIADILREALAPLRDRISLAFVHGSIAQGTERRASDIDLMIVGTVALEDVVQALQSAQQQLRREINPSVYRSAEFRRKAQEKGGFIARVVAGAKLFIAGNADDLGKPGAHRKAETS
jgi:DNA-binding transcriptional ArsR family regulator